MKEEKLIGKTYGRLTILSFAEPIIYPKTPTSKKQIKRVVNCVCICGNLKTTRFELLTSKHTKSCGCLKKETTFETFTTHGLTDTSEYTTWMGMRQRCNDKNSSGYKYYGEKGIKICERWNKFENFIEDMGFKPHHNYSLDRVDNNLGYFKENCRWTTLEKQMNNTSRNKYIEYKNKTQSLANWCRELNLDYYKIRSRFNYKWSVEKAFETK